MKRLAILGASGHGKVVADTAECCGWSDIEFYDDAWPNLKANGAWVVSGDTVALVEQIAQYDGVLVAIGDNRIRQLKIRELIRAGAKMTTLIHPTATVSRYARLGVGSVVFAGAIMNVSAAAGEGTILNTGCSVDHDCILGNAVHISPGVRLAGNVRVGDLSWIGIGACVRQSICIGRQVTVGAGAAVVSHLADNIIVVGVPALGTRR